MSKRDRATSSERAVFDKKTEEILEQKAASNNEKYKVKPITEGHKNFIETIEDCEFIICSGPAGSGKTHLALGKGIEYLRANKVKKLLLVRPLQECGRSIGHMPGEKDAKIAPHMLAFKELFCKFLPESLLNRYVENEQIVIDICEFMRGRTFDDTYIVVDEAQNLSFEQLNMLISRVGQRSKIVFVGDASQNDLPHWLKYDNRVPLEVMMDRLEDRDDDIGVVDLGHEDIVRNAKLAKILLWMSGKG